MIFYLSFRPNDYILILNPQFMIFLIQIIFENLNDQQKMKSWTTQEDKILTQLYNNAPNFRKWKWITNSLAEKGIIKTQYQCRQRFINKLDPSVKQQNWNIEQIKKIFRIYDEYGSEWCSIQKFLSGRTQNSIKNKFYSVLRNAIRSLIKSAIFLLYNLQVTYHDPSSSQLIDLYNGKKKFSKVKGLIQQCLKSVNYRMDKDKLSIFIQKNHKKIEVLLDLMIFDKIQKPPKNQNFNQSLYSSTKDIKIITGIQHQNSRENSIKEQGILLQDSQNQQQIDQIKQIVPQQLSYGQLPEEQLRISQYSNFTGINYDFDFLNQMNQYAILNQGQFPSFLFWCSTSQINAIFQNLLS